MAESSTTEWSLQRLLQWTTDYFTESGCESARLDAEVLLAEALQCQRIELYTRFAEVPPADTLTRFREWVKRRAAGEPVAYIVGHREFYSLRFAVDPNVLIPRPETEHVVVEALEACKDFPSPVRIIDVGTGSGCIGISLAVQLKNDFRIAATDLSLEALAVARTNAAAHGVDEKIRFYEGDLLEALPAGSNPVHLIVSNPPYIGRGEADTVEEGVKKYEPDSALFAGETGTEIISRLVEQADRFLLPGGQLIFEASPAVMDACVAIVEGSSLEFVKVIDDYAGLKRVLVARKSGGQEDGAVATAETPAQ